MSKTIDQRVVEMRFDNKQFESNVQTSMSTLDKLKQSLNLSGASKGLSSLNKAASNVNMSGLSGAIDTINSKFSVMDVVGVTAIANITNSAVNAGKRMISALTIDPVKTGFQEYETQINSIQTILANTSHAGTTIDQVNAALDELNKYADETIYNFTEMTRNIGTFTAAGVDLDTSVASIKGIANLAAISGSTSQQASTAMYQLSQALAAGRVSLMDWNSVVNAGMGGKVFQDALVRTSEVLGTGAQAAIDEYGSFRESLTRGEWLTTQVLTETLQQFAGAYSEADLIAQGFTESQAKEITKMAETAKSAATDVKTFTQLWDVMKESAQSGWSQTWKIIVGDMEEAKALLSPIADFFTGENGIINKMSNFRNTIVEGVLDFATPWQRIMDKLNGAGFGKIKEVAENISNATDKLKYFQDIVNQVWHGDYKNADTGRYELLEAAGYDHRVVQDLVNKGLGYKLTVEDIEASHKKFGLTMETTSENTEKMSDVLANLTDEQLRNAGLTDDEIALYRALAKEADKLGISISELADRMSKNDGRSLLIDSFKNIGKVIVEFAGVIKTAYVEIFDPPTTGEIIVKLYGMITAFNEFTKKLKLVDSETGKLTDTGDKLKRIFKGLFAIIDMIATVTGGAFKIALKIVTGLLKYFGVDALTAAASLADGVVAFRDWVDESLGFSKAIDGIVNLLGKGIEAIRDWLREFKKTKTFTSIIGYFKSTGEAIRDWITGLKEAENIPKYIIDGLVKGFANGVKRVIDGALNIGKVIVQTIKDFLGIESPSKVFIAIGGFIISGLIIGLLKGIPGVGETLGTLVSKITEVIGNIDWGTIFAGGVTAGLTYGVIKIAKAFSAVTSVFEGVGDVMSGVGEVLEKSAKPIAKVLKNTAKVVKSFANVMNSIAFKKNTEGIRNIAISLAILVGAIAVLSFLDIDKVQDAVWIVAQLAIILGVLSVAVGLMNKSALDMEKGSLKISGFSNGIIGIGAAILALAVVAKLLGSMNPDSLDQGLHAMTGIAIGILVFMAALQLIGKLPGKTIDNVGSNLLKIAGAIAILAIVAKVMSNMELDELNKATAGLMLLMGCIAVLMLIAMIPTKRLQMLGDNLLKISGAIAILAIVAKVMSNMELDELNKATAGLMLLMGCIAVLMLIAMIPTKRLNALGDNILKISGAIALLAITAKILATMEWDEMGRAAIGLLGLTAVIAALIYITRLAGGNKLDKVGTTVLLLSVSIGILGGVLTLLGFLNIKHIAKGLLAVGLLTLFMSGLIKATRDAKDIKGNLIIMAVTIGVMAAAVGALSFIDPTRLAIATGAMALLMGIFALMISASSKASKSIGSLVILTLAVGLLGILLLKMDEIRDPESVLSCAVGLSLLLATMAGVLILISKIGKISAGSVANLLLVGLVVAELAVILGIMADLDSEPSIKTAVALSIMLASMAGALALVSVVGKTSAVAVGNLGLLGLVVAELAIILGIMAEMDVEPSLSTVAALSIMLGVMAGVLVIISNVGKTSTGAVGNLMLLGLVVAELAVILGVMTTLDAEPSIETAMALSIMLGVMAGVLLLISNVGATSAGAVGAMLLLGLVVGELAIILGLMSAFDVNPSIETAAALSILLVSMSASLLLLGVVGTLGPAAFIGIAALATLIAGIGGLIIGIGALMDKFPMLEEFLNKGIPVVEKIGYAIGSFFGNIIGGFLGNLTSGLPDMATDLSNFMTNLQPFIEGAKNITNDVLVGIGCLSGAIIALTIADFIQGITQFMTLGSSFSDLGTELSNFMINAMPFIESASLLTTDMLGGVKALAETILILTAANILEGLTSWLTGGSSLADFGAQLPALGANIASFATSLGTFDDTKVSSVNCAANAIKALATAANEIPNEGGLWASIVGDNSLATFSSYLPGLGTNLSSFVTNLGTFSPESVTTVGSACDAIKALASAAKEIPNEGGLWASIVGDNSLATFGSYLPGLARHLSSFVSNLGTFSPESVATVGSACDAIKALASAAKTIPNQGGFWASIVGDNSLATFGNDLDDLGDGLADFVKELGTFGNDQVTTVTCAANAVKVLAQAANAIPKTGGLWQWLAGENSLSAFGDELEDLGEGLSGFADELGVFNADKVATVNCAVSAIKSLASLAGTNLEGAIEHLDDFGDELEGLGSNIADFVEALPQTSSINESISNIKKIVQMVKDFSGADTKIATDFTKSLKTMGKAGVKEFVEAFTSKSAQADVKKAGVELVKYVGKGIESDKKTIKTAVEGAAKNGASGAEGAKKSFKSAGSSLVDGFAAGISENSYKAAAKAKAMAEAAAEAAKKALKINSPSKIFMAIGSSIPEGFAKGIGKLGGDIEDSAVSMADLAVQSVGNSISRIADVINSDIDSQPTIRPVLDLTDVRSGANSINSLFDTDTSVGVLGRVSSINYAMNRRNQNGADGEVVTAINKLRRDIGSTKPVVNNYNLNGITYDDGSNLSEAVKVIIREAKIERRT